MHVKGEPDLCTLTGLVAARFVTTARFVTDSQPAHFVTPARFVITW